MSGRPPQGPAGAGCRLRPGVEQADPARVAALEAIPRAAEAFAALDSANRFAMRYRIETAKRQETRDRHVARFIDMLERGERTH